MLKIKICEHNTSMNVNKQLEKRNNRKRKCLDSNKLNDMKRTTITNESIKVTIMNNLNSKQCDAVTNEIEGGKDDGGPYLLKVIFANNEKYMELKATISNSIQKGLNRKHLVIKNNDGENCIEIFEDFNGLTQHDRDLTEESGTNLFMIDTEPENVSKANKANAIEIPVYTKTNVLLTTDRIEKNNQNKRQGGMSCFNCGENHNLKDCKKPRNHLKIQQRMSQLKGGDRYHIEPNQKYANVVPGKLSRSLRDALGLRKHEIPSHIYRMRIFGYPPGWLEDHKISNSGLALFDSDGKTVVLDSDEEQGEIVEKEQYDLNKIIEFPGFNVPPSNYAKHDEHHRHNVPPMSDDQSKETMIHFLSDKLVTPYKRKKLKNFPGVNNTSDDNNVEEQCMEIDEEDEHVDYCESMLTGVQPPLPVENIAISAPLPPPPLPDGANLIESDESGEIISDDEDSKKNVTQPETPRSSAETIEETTRLKAHQTEAHTLDDDNKKVILSTERSDTNLCTTKFETNGTPLLQFSPYTSLPTGDKFSVGVSDVINFENLPDSTGKYENMKEILKRVRNHMEQLNEN